MDYKLAEVSRSVINKISEYEKELKKITDKKIILVAYQEEK